MRGLLIILLLFCNELILNLLNKLEEKRNNSRLIKTFIIFHNELKIKNIIARTLDLIYQIKLKKIVLSSRYWYKNVWKRDRNRT